MNDTEYRIMAAETAQGRWLIPQGQFANTITHALGAALSVVALAFMVAYSSFDGSPYKIVSASIFGASMVALYAASTFYHISRHPDWKKFLRLVDHSCIYLLIAGTYTPFTLVTLRGGWGWSMFGIVWGLALAGVLFKVFLINRFHYLSVAIYLGMGWLGIVALGPVVSKLSVGGIAWIVAGGLAYTGGVAFYVWRSLPYHHAIWHLFVMAGTACHFAAVYWHVLPAQA
jgi:hemolysin III